MYTVSKPESIHMHFSFSLMSRGVHYVQTILRHTTPHTIHDYNDKDDIRLI